MSVWSAIFGRRQAGGPLVLDNAAAHPGSVFWVHSGTGTDAVGFGHEPGAPTATIAYAIALCAANNGDVVYVRPGHNEGFGNAQLAVNVAGISIIGLGRGSARPRIDFDHANASIDVTASGCAIKNIVLLPSVTDTLIGIDVNTLVTDTLIEDIEVLPGEDGAGVDEFACTVDIKVGCSRTIVRRVKHRQHASAAGVIAGVRIAGASDDVTIEDCDIVALGAAVQGCLYGLTTLSTNLRVNRCVLVSDTKPGIKFLTGTTGVLADNSIFTNLATIAAAIVADGCASFRNQYVEIAPESGAVIGTASVDD